MMCWWWSAASFPTRTWKISKRPAWPPFSSRAQPWTTSSSSFAPTSNRAACPRPVDIDGRDQHLTSEGYSAAYRRAHPVVLEDFSRLQFGNRSALRLDSSWQRRAAGLSGHSGIGAGSRQTTACTQYLLPALLRTTL